LTDNTLERTENKGRKINI